jgi:hypothetical protein
MSNGLPCLPTVTNPLQTLFDNLRLSFAERNIPVQRVFLTLEISPVATIDISQRAGVKGTNENTTCIHSGYWTL